MMALQGNEGTASDIAFAAPAKMASGFAEDIEARPASIGGEGWESAIRSVASKSDRSEKDRVGKEVQHADDGCSPCDSLKLPNHWVELPHLLWVQRSADRRESLKGHAADADDARPAADEFHPNTGSNCYACCWFMS